MWFRQYYLAKTILDYCDSVSENPANKVHNVVTSYVQNTTIVITKNKISLEIYSNKVKLVTI